MLQGIIVKPGSQYDAGTSVHRASIAQRTRRDTGLALQSNYVCTRDRHGRRRFALVAVSPSFQTSQLSQKKVGSENISASTIGRKVPHLASGTEVERSRESLSLPQDVKGDF